MIFVTYTAILINESPASLDTGYPQLVPYQIYHKASPTCACIFCLHIVTFRYSTSAATRHLVYSITTHYCSVVRQRQTSLWM